MRGCRTGRRWSCFVVMWPGRGETRSSELDFFSRSTGPVPRAKVPPCRFGTTGRGSAAYGPSFSVSAPAGGGHAPATGAKGAVLGHAGPATWVDPGTQRPYPLRPRTRKRRARDLGRSWDAAALSPMPRTRKTPVPRLGWILARSGPHHPCHGLGNAGPATLVDPGTQRPYPLRPRTRKTPVPRLGWILASSGPTHLGHGLRDAGPATWVGLGVQRPDPPRPRTSGRRSRDLGRPWRAAAVPPLTRTWGEITKRTA